MKSAIFALFFVLGAAPPPPPAQEPTRKGIVELRWELDRITPFAQSQLAKRFAAGVSELGTVPTRTLYRTEDKSRWFKPAEMEKLPEAEKKALVKVEVDEETYYTTRYGSPLSYVRPLDILAAAGFTGVEKKKILDFGYGYFTHLRLLGMLGADAHGVDVDPMLPKLYSEPGDTGPVKSKSGLAGKVTLHAGRYPAEPALTREIGEGYDLIISKNVLKFGYLHPRRPTEERKLVKLGVSDEEFLATIHRALVPGGLFLIFNICPAQAPADKPYLPWADGTSPFPRAMLEKAGFTVRDFDHEDTAKVREMAHLLGWDLPYDGEPGMDLEHDLFAWYTLVEKKR